MNTLVQNSVDTTTIEKSVLLSETLADLLDFTFNDTSLNSDFEEFIKTVGAKSLTKQDLMPFLINYIFEREIDNKTVFQLFMDKYSSNKKSFKDAIKSLSATKEILYEVKRVARKGFVLKNILNEKEISVSVLTRMTDFRDVLPAQFLNARVCELDKEYYLVNISSTFSSSKKDEVYRYAIAKILHNPELLYKDNKEKQKEIEKTVKNLHRKFIALFNRDEIITDNKNVDKLISVFNDYVETAKAPEVEVISANIVEPEKYSFFEVKEFSSQYNNFLENSMGGFAAHKELYDVGMVFLETEGLYIVPFWGTMKKGLNSDYKNINGFKDCFSMFLNSEKISPLMLKRLADENPQFTAIYAELFHEALSIDEIILKYKSEQVSKKNFSPMTVLYTADVFLKTVQMIENQEQSVSTLAEQAGKSDLVSTRTTKAKPNEPCPCGSGKKYKKCCGLKK